MTLNINAIEYCEYYSTPVGILKITASDTHVRTVGFVKAGANARPNAITALTVEQLGQYFQQQRTSFDLPINAQGTAFQMDVWQALSRIPYGTTKSYAEVAKEIGRPKAVRAVGAANGRNPLGIVVPCHRVIGSNGQLTGFAHGVDKKGWLLKHEGAVR